MSAVAVTARLNPPGPVTVTAAFVPAGSPVMVTLKAPVVAVQATANAAVTVSPAETVTVRGFCPCALQLAAKPPRRTACWPGASASSVTLALRADRARRRAVEAHRIPVGVGGRSPSSRW